MARPTQGEFYTAEDGDTLPSIAIKAGLVDNWQLIREANQLTLKTTDQEAVQPGERLYIPEDPVIIALKNSRADL